MAPNVFGMVEEPLMNALTAKSDEEVDQRHLVRSQASALVVEKKKPLAYCESQKFKPPIPADRAPGVRARKLERHGVGCGQHQPAGRSTGKFRPRTPYHGPAGRTTRSPVPSPGPYRASLAAHDAGNDRSKRPVSRTP